MANEIKAKYGSPTSLTCTLASLASSTAGVGRQTTLVDNSSNKFQRVHIYFKVTTGTSPTANKSIQFYLLKFDAGSSATLATDAAGATDAGLTVVTADQVYAVPTSNGSNTAYVGTFVVDNPGPGWALCIVHDTAVALHATGGNHSLEYVGDNPEVQ